MLLGYEPRCFRLCHLICKARPCLHHALAKFCTTPFFNALFDLRRCEKQNRARTRQAFGTTQVFNVRTTYGAAVFQIGKARMYSTTQSRIARKINVDARGIMF